MKRLLDIDEFTGQIRWHEYDEGEDRALIHTETDITATLEANKRAQNDGTDGWSADRNWRKVAEIPIVCFDLWKQMYGVDLMKRENQGLLKRLLNDPSLSMLRTSSGKLDLKDR